MKKFEMLGKVLSREEQKKIKGGPIDPPKCKTDGACTQDSDCRTPQVDCICGTTVVDPNPKCYWEG